MVTDDDEPRYVHVKRSDQDIIRALLEAAAVSNRNWRYLHYFRSPGAAAAWHDYLATHERYPHGETHEV